MADSSSLLDTLYNLSLATAVREGSTSFPWLESVHVLAVGAVVGTIAIVDLRLVGYRSHRRGARQLINDMLPFTWVAFALAVATGGLMFISNANAYWANIPFLLKMLAILAAGVNMAIFHVTAHRNVGQWDEDPRPPLAARIAGGASLMLWLVAVCLGRWIGFTLM